MAASNDPQPDDTTSRVLWLLDLAYEAAFAAADEGTLDWSTIGEPVAKAITLLRSDVAA